MDIARLLWLIRLVMEVIRLILDHLDNGGSPQPLAHVARRWMFDPHTVNTLREAILDLESTEGGEELAANLRDTLPPPWLA